jgi:hypothetical protein
LDTQITCPKDQPLMTPEPATVPPPDHPLPALTTYELRNYRNDLEHALATLPGRAAARVLLQGNLAEVLAEQESRLKIAGVRA